MQTVLVTDADRGSALAIIRSLDRAGWRVIAGAHDMLSPGLRSRHASERVLYPSPLTHGHQFVTSLLQVVCEKKVDLIIPVTEEVILHLARERQSFEKYCQIAMPDPTLLEATRDKERTIELARRLDVPIPRTSTVETTEEAVAQTGEFQWPVVLKPAMSRTFMPQTREIEKLSVSYANDVETLIKKMRRYEGRSRVLLQEYYPGVGQGVELLARDGQPLAIFQHRRICELPVQGGASALRESMALDPQLFEYARRLTAALNWTGLLMIEFKVGEYGPKLMEINGRVWGSLPLAVASGMNFPVRLAALYQHPQMDVPDVPESDYHLDVQAADVEMLLLWALQVLWGVRRYDFLPFPPRRAVLDVMRRVLSFRIKYDILSLRDPWPGLIVLLKLNRKLFCKIWVLILKNGGRYS